jgi:anti-sigma-K factor RskA
MKLTPDLMEQLAASYALGTLRGGARRRFESLARANPALRTSALMWQTRLGSVAELQPEEAPSAAVWKRIENLVEADLASKRQAAVRAAGAPAVQASSWWTSLGWWRGAAAAGAFASVAAVLVGVNVTGQLKGQVGELSARLQATPEIEYVAVLADDQSSASMLVTFDPKNNRLQLKRVGAFREGDDKSLQLWALPPSGGPRSLGVLNNEPVVRLAATTSDVREVPTLAISLEPKGGAPTGSGPTGPVLFKGALLQTSL